MMTGFYRRRANEGHVLQPVNTFSDFVTDGKHIPVDFSAGYPARDHITVRVRKN